MPLSWDALLGNSALLQSTEHAPYRLDTSLLGDLGRHVSTAACSTINSPAYSATAPFVSNSTWTTLSDGHPETDADILELWGGLNINGAVTAEIKDCSSTIKATSAVSRRERLMLIQSTLTSDEVLRSLSKKVIARGIDAAQYSSLNNPEYQLKVLCGALAAIHGYESFAKWFCPLVHQLVAVVNTNIETFFDQASTMGYKPDLQGRKFAEDTNYHPLRGTFQYTSPVTPCSTQHARLRHASAPPSHVSGAFATPVSSINAIDGQSTSSQHPVMSKLCGAADRASMLTPPPSIKSRNLLSHGFKDGASLITPTRASISVTSSEPKTSTDVRHGGNLSSQDAIASPASKVSLNSPVSMIKPRVPAAQHTTGLAGAAKNANTSKLDLFSPATSPSLSGLSHEVFHVESIVEPKASTPTSACTFSPNPRPLKTPLSSKSVSGKRGFDTVRECETSSHRNLRSRLDVHVEDSPTAYKRARPASERAETAPCSVTTTSPTTAHVGASASRAVKRSAALPSEAEQRTFRRRSRRAHKYTRTASGRTISGRSDHLVPPSSTIDGTSAERVGPTDPKLPTTTAFARSTTTSPEVKARTSATHSPPAAKRARTESGFANATPQTSDSDANCVATLTVPGCLDTEGRQVSEHASAHSSPRSIAYSLRHGVLMASPQLIPSRFIVGFQNRLQPAPAFANLMTSTFAFTGMLPFALRRKKCETEPSLTRTTADCPHPLLVASPVKTVSITACSDGLVRSKPKESTLAGTTGPCNQPARARAVKAVYVTPGSADETRGRNPTSGSTSVDFTLASYAQYIRNAGRSTAYTVEDAKHELAELTLESRKPSLFGPVRKSAFPPIASVTRVKVPLSARIGHRRRHYRHPPFV